MMDDSNIVIDSKVIAESIKNIRLTHNLSQEEFAKVLNVSPKLVSKWENGARIPRIETFKLINKKYGITFEEITTGLFKPELTEEKAIEYLFKQRITKIIIIISIIIIMFLSALINSRSFIYTFSAETKNVNIPEGNMIIDASNNLNINIIKIDTADFISGKINIKIYINKKPKKILYSCQYNKNKCEESFKISNITKNQIMQNLDNIYIDVIYNNETTSSKLMIQKHNSNQSIRNLVVIPNNLVKKHERIQLFNYCISLNKKELYKNIQNYPSVFIYEKEIYIIKKKQLSCTVIHNMEYVTITEKDNFIYFGDNKDIMSQYNYKNKEVCFEGKDKYYKLLLSIIRNYS